MKKYKVMNRILAVVLTLALVVAGTIGSNTLGIPAGSMTAEAGTNAKPATEVIQDMGLGFNLGNQFDAGSETGWINKVIDNDTFATIKARGFNTVRIPVTWDDHISDDGNYTIDATYMARIKEVVDLALANDLYVIINVHHEDWINRKDFETAEAAMKTELAAVWEQIADEFKNYDQHLIFEGLNEPRAAGTDYEWWLPSNLLTSYTDIINHLDQTFIDTVRDSGGNNTYRILMVPQYAASSDASINSCIDSSFFDDDYVAMSIHAYSPYDFAMASSSSNTTFNDSYNYQLYNLFTQIKTNFIDKGYPVILGEFSASDNDNTVERTKWAKAYMTYAKELGIACVLWDNTAVYTGSCASENHGYLNRFNNEWYPRSASVIDELLYVLKDSDIAWGSGNLTYCNDLTVDVATDYVDFDLETPSSDVSHFDINNGTHTGATVCGYTFGKSGAGSIDLTSYSSLWSAFTTGTELAVKYDGDAPALAFMDSSWGSWTVVLPYDIDTANEIAYFSYADYAEAAATAGVSSYAHLLFHYDESSYAVGEGSTIIEAARILPQATKANVVSDSKLSLTLNGQIGLNFYESFKSLVTADTDAYVEITDEDGNVVGSAAVADSLDSTTGYYKFSGYVNAKDTEKDLTATLHMSNDVRIELGTYSVTDYTDTIAADSSASASLKKLAAAIDDYGNTFQHSKNATVALNDSAITTYNTYVSALDNEAYKGSVTVKSEYADALTYCGSSLVTTSLMQIRHYFKVKDADQVSTANMTANAAYYYYTIEDIAPVDFATAQALPESDYATSSYSVLSYAYAVTHSATYKNTDLKYVATAIYNYYLTAKTYFGN